MIYKFILISDEVDNFKREIQIDPDSMFIDLHNTIFKSIDYKPVESASFLICEDDWETREIITLSDIDDNPEYDIWLMNNTPINEFLEDEKQRLIHEFDTVNKRYFYLELTEIITGKNIKKAKCSLEIGEPPLQFLEEEITTSKKNNTLDVDETFYGDSDYDSLEIEGFENLEEL